MNENAFGGPALPFHSSSATSPRVASARLPCFCDSRDRLFPRSDCFRRLALRRTLLYYHSAIASPPGSLTGSSPAAHARAHSDARAMVCADDGATRALTSAVGHHHRPVRTRRDRSRAACAPPREACAKPRAHGSTLGCWQAGWHDLGSASTSRTRCSSIWRVGAPPPRSSARASARASAHARAPQLRPESPAYPHRIRMLSTVAIGRHIGYAEAMRQAMRRLYGALPIAYAAKLCRIACAACCA